MLQFLICDDNVPFAESLRRQISECLVQRNMRSEIRICAAPEDFAGMVFAQAPDIVFMDLVLDGETDGYALAEQLRRSRTDCEIVFITNYPERMTEAFPFRPIGFISKPADDESIAAVIDRYLSFYWHVGEEDYILTSRSQNVRVPLRDILYFESEGHEVKLYRASTETPLSQFRRLDEIAAQLEDKGFVRIHKSFLVRMHAIARIDRTAMRVVLFGGGSLPISRRRYGELMEIFIHFRLR